MWNARSFVRGSWLRATVSAMAVAFVIVAISQVWRGDTKRIDAQLALADTYYDSHDLANAEVAYRKLTESPKSSAYWYAMYKLGLIDFDLRRFRQASDKLFEVALGTKDDRELAGLHRSSTTEFVRAYAEVGDADKAYPTFRQIDPDRALDMLVTLADFYLSQGSNDKAIRTYQQLMKLAFADDRVCLWQYNIAHAQLWMAGSNNGNTVTQIENLVRLSRMLHASHRLPAVEDKECHDNAAAMAGELARAYHNEAARTKSAETLAYAERLYEVYLDAFPDAEDFPETQYFYAEVLWSRAETETDLALQPRRWQDAAAAFTNVVNTRKVHAKLMKESAYAAVLGWKNALNAEPPAVTPNDDGVAPIPIPDSTRSLVAAIDAYIAVVNKPNDDDVGGLEFIKAGIYRRFHHFDDAIQLLEGILAHQLEHAIAEDAATLLVDTLDQLGRHDAMFAVIDSLLASPKFLHGNSDPWLVRLRDGGIPLSSDAIATKRKRHSP
jgi:TolA-binding protein